MSRIIPGKEYSSTPKKQGHQARNTSSPKKMGHAVSKQNTASPDKEKTFEVVKENPRITP